MFQRAAGFIHTPEPQEQLSPDDTEDYVRIGNLTYCYPGNKIWNGSQSIAKTLIKPLIHITLDQRRVFTIQQQQSLTIFAVHKCGVRREYWHTSSRVEDILKETILIEPTL